MVRHLLCACAAMAAAFCCASATPAAEPDATTPKGALEVFVTALAAGDAQKVGACLDATAETAKVKEGMQQWATSAAKLREAVMVKLGKDAAGGLKIDPLIDKDDVLKKLTPEGEEKDAEAKIDGDKATIDATSPTQLKKVGGVWVIDLDATLKAAGEDIAQVAKDFQDDAKDLDKISAGMSSGKYKTIEDVNKVLEEGFDDDGQ